MQRLHDTLLHRTGRGTPVGADTMIERVAAELRGQEAPRSLVVRKQEHVSTTEPTAHEGVPPAVLQRRPRWRAVAAFGAALVIVLGGVGVVALLPRGEEVVGDTNAAMVATTPPTTAQTTTTVTTTTTEEPTTAPVTVAPAVVPALGEGWEFVFSSVPGDALFLDPGAVFPTGAGYYVNFLDVETYENGWYLVTPDDGESTLVDVGVPASSSAGGFVTGGPGVVAWTAVGPETDTEAQLWVSSDSINFERVAQNLLTGCEGVTGCRGTQIYAAAASPSGRVVALAYDPLVWDAACECFELNPVALVSDDGYVWSRQPLNLLSVLPAEWQEAATIENPLVYVDGRWLTYAWRFGESIYTSDTAFFASDNGIDWQLVDTGDLFDGTHLTGIAANDSGVVAITGGDVYWSTDGNEWTRTVVTSTDDLLKVAAYDDGYVVVSMPTVTGEGSPSTDSIWYSAEGTLWTRITLELEGATWRNWNAIVGDGPNLAAVGGQMPNNMRAIWRWSE